MPVRLPARAVSIVLVVGFMVCAGAIGEASTRTFDLLEDGFSGLRERARVVNYRLSPPQHRTGGELSEGYQQLVRYVRRCTPERSRLLALTFVPELFFYTGREFAGGHVMFNPGYYVGDRHTSLTLARLAREDVPLVVVDVETRQEMAATYPRLFEYVGRRYREAGDFMIRPGRTLVVLADTTRPAVGKFDGTALPCFQGTI